MSGHARPERAPGPTETATSTSSDITFIPGQRVRATCQVTEGGGGGGGDPTKPFLDEDGYPDPAYVHAEPGEEGVVESIDNGDPFVRFDRTGTATIVSAGEITPL